MKNNDSGLLLVISGPSGVGKDTILHSLLSKKDNLKLSVSATTRKPRNGEQNKIDYFFIDREKFLKMAENEELFEYAEYCGNFYGTPKKYVNEELQKGNDVILEIETQGALQVIGKERRAISIFISPPSFDALKSRLVNRGTDSIDIIEKRIEVAKKELNLVNKYDYLVINDDVDSCVNDIINIIESEKLRVSRNKNFIKGVLENA